MSMQPQPIPPVPEDTAAVARATFPKGNLYLQLHDTLGSIYQDDLWLVLNVKGIDVSRQRLAE